MASAACTMRPLRLIWCFFIAVSGAYATTAFSADPCADFKWDVAKEHALFGGPGASVDAAKDPASSPVLVLDRLYQLALVPQKQVAFALPPGKKTAPDDTYGGVAAFKIKTSGAYRVSVDTPLWIDVIADGTLVEAKDFQGQGGCKAPRKIVEYELTAGQPLRLQLSGSSTAVVRLTVTQSQPVKR